MMPFEQCNCMALRRASRRITNFYDGKLAPTGLRVTQYAILALLGKHGGVSSPTDGRSRTITLTNSGGVALKAAAGLWRRAQAEFESANGGAIARALRSTLANLKVGR